MDSSRRVYSLCLIFAALWCCLILAAPLLQSFSDQTQTTATILYRFFSRICHQLDERSFHLNGHPLAVCIRCSSLYGGFLLGLLVFPMLRGFDARSVPPRLWLILACLPMLVDVLLSVANIHESTTWTRMATGLLVGTVAPFYLLPPLVEAVAQRFYHLSTTKGEHLYARKTE